MSNTEYNDPLTQVVLEGESKETAQSWYDKLNAYCKGLLEVPVTVTLNGMAWSSRPHHLAFCMKTGLFAYLNSETTEGTTWSHLDRPDLTEMYLPYFYRKEEAER